MKIEFTILELTLLRRLLKARAVEGQMAIPSDGPALIRLTPTPVSGPTCRRLRRAS